MAWRGADERNAKELILDDYETGGFIPSSFIKMIDKNVLTVLDFGCGIGRNLIALAEGRRYVHGFDFPNMIAMAMKDDTIADDDKIALMACRYNV